ncbi:hypothetical protein H0H81_010427 [Sphagnurus paluster]|uniref:Uncharacterized protein n=1 Tax=Sphagnurus paluster TaxID=117069 RepID=A0A9P7GI01_9AGAR|nr:hypothetical protein H0H81_010427 [Sphagnurus paluster]
MKQTDFTSNATSSILYTPSDTRPTTPYSGQPRCGDDDMDDEHTLSGFGDISLSNIYFVPSLPSDVSPRRDDSWITEELKLKQTPPPSVRKIPALKIQHPLPSVIQNILPPSPSAAQLSPGSDFERLIAKLRETRVPEKTHHSPSKATQQLQPQPRHTINGMAIDNLNANAKAGGAKDRGLLVTTARQNAPKPKIKEKPFRGGRLPVRPPLPRWDLHNGGVPQ